MSDLNHHSALTKRQCEIYEHLREQIASRGFSPTVREIGDHFNIRSPNGVICHLKALERKGLITRESNTSRAIVLTAEANRGISVAYMGAADSGGPIRAAVSSDERIRFDSLFSGDDKACLRVRGMTFQALGIIDGDLLIVSRESRGDVGTLLAALDEEHRVTLQRIAADGKPPMPAIPRRSQKPTRQILGCVVGVVRDLQAQDA